ncbi:hypothetical protein SAMN04488523_1264 [Sulfitobacter brevis]|uniref:Uncharacterized protein n=1 Tax=Sulfitobacter brevis TaxID=74348 RepID=A0A1I2GL19_9RHOB|nr:hypothetical protein SAMN04488523_1264 [Sulfitobacter brevis]
MLVTNFTARSILVLEVSQLRDEGLFKITFGSVHCHRGTHCFFAYSIRVGLHGVKSEHEPR